MATHLRDMVLNLVDPPEIDAFLRQLPIAFVIAEAPGGRIISANERAEQIWGGPLPSAAAIADYSSGYTGFRADGRQYAADEWPLARALEHGEVVVDEEIEFRFASGDRRILLVSARPLQDASGEVTRAIALFHDVTEQRQEDRRREFLMELSDELRTLDDAQSIMATAAVATGEHLGISSASYADVDESGEFALVPAEYRHGRVAAPGRYHLEDFGPDLIAKIRAADPVVVEDLEAVSEPHDIFEGWGIRSIIAVPIVRQDRLLALFTVLHTAPRNWTRSDVALVVNVAERTWHAVENARAQAELRRSREWLALALRAGAAAIWEWDLRSGEIQWSEEGDALLGSTLPHTLTFSRWLALVHPADRGEAKKAAHHIAAQREGEIGFEYRVGTQEPRWITMRGRIVADASGVPARVIGVAVDSTERKTAELEREALLQEARDASEAKSHFISVISHEFRTPLTAIIGYTDLLSTGVSGPLAPNQVGQLDRIRTSAWHMTQMVDEILTFSRLEAGGDATALATTDITALARETVALVAPAAASKDLGLACELPDEPCLALTDSGKLRQVLLNLLGNAVKFTDRGGITMRVRRDADRIVFTVIDTGVGIAEDHIDRIFERFWQVGQNDARHLSGAGLGLTVSRRLIELLGGDISVQSAPGQGSTFTFSIPSTPAA